MLLEDYLHLWSGRKFDWNNHTTCAHFAAGWVRLIEGWDPMAGTPKFWGVFGARTLLQRDFGGSLLDASTQLLGRAPLPTPRMAQVGDIVLLPGSWFGALGICNGLRVAVLRDGGGVDFVESDQAEAAWRVGSE